MSEVRTEHGSTHVRVGSDTFSGQGELCLTDWLLLKLLDELELIDGRLMTLETIAEAERGG